MNEPSSVITLFIEHSPDTIYLLTNDHNLITKNVNERDGTHRQDVHGLTFHIDIIRCSYLLTFDTITVTQKLPRADTDLHRQK